MQPLHEAGDALLQAVDGMVLRIMATEAVAQAAESISDELEVTGLWPSVGDSRGTSPCHWKDKAIALRAVTVVVGHLICLSFHAVSQKNLFML